MNSDLLDTTYVRVAVYAGALFFCVGCWGFVVKVLFT